MGRACSSRHTINWLRITPDRQSLAAGAKNVDLARKHGVSEAMLCNWKSKQGGQAVPEAKLLRALEDEDGRLKRLLADAMLDNAS